MNRRRSAERSPARSDRTEQAAGMNEGMRVLSYLIAGTALYGGLGWLGDYLLHTAFLLPVGIVVGAGLGIYTTIRRLGASTLTGGDPVGPSVTDSVKEDAR